METGIELYIRHQKRVGKSIILLYNGRRKEHQMENDYYIY